ncbi:MAG: hypothetical protein ACRD2X_09950 [Vicinamibacteraceae bacterium]
MTSTLHAPEFRGVARAGDGPLTALNVRRNGQEDEALLPCSPLGTNAAAE